MQGMSQQKCCHIINTLKCNLGLRKIAKREPLNSEDWAKISTSERNAK